VISLELNPDLRVLRQFGWAALAVFAAAGVQLLLRDRIFGLHAGTLAVPLALLCFFVGGLSALLSLIAPRANRFLYLALTLLAFPIAWLVSWALVLALYFLVLTPAGLALRLLRADPMARDLDRARESYWEPLPPPPGPERYFKQY
jgi:hypothetical protein